MVSFPMWKEYRILSNGCFLILPISTQAKRTSYFSNFINSDLSSEDALSMRCRLRLDKRELIKRGGGLFGANPLTGSIIFKAVE
jgi:hypothetical protein